MFYGTLVNCAAQTMLELGRHEIYCSKVPLHFGVCKDICTGRSDVVGLEMTAIDEDHHERCEWLT